MPHFIVEYFNESNSNLTAELIANAVYTAACECGLFSKEDIKIRAFCPDFVIFDSAAENHVHITVKLFSGRSKWQIAKMREMIVHGVESLPISSLALSVEIVSLTSDNYFKKTLRQKEVSIMNQV
ncbi:5-carboxymethyl-2-hydroxymuconate Delta-isomerase [Teredinibacter turnerae]|uniref:5-carboxymethyl-2-hydroxymuconate Delta-isomerase n=1 Tax=Teredinibacter turnerae TaxID=2426 RepID=UPI00041C1193|nr:hypothetical protein [Teredinibacter turnerae]